MSEIKPCPFCGDAVSLWNSYAVHTGNLLGYCIKCKRCGIEKTTGVISWPTGKKDETLEEAKQILISAWNRRATVSKETAQKIASNLDTLLDEMVNIQSKLAKGEQEGWEGSKRRLALKNSCIQSLAQFEAEKGGGK